MLYWQGDALKNFQAYAEFILQTKRFLLSTSTYAAEFSSEELPIAVHYFTTPNANLQKNKVPKAK